MKLKTTIIIFSSLLGIAIHGQSFEWAKTFGGADDDYGVSVVDASGNVYTTGSFEGTVDFDPSMGTAFVSDQGQTDIFVQKINASGGLVWIKSFGGTGGDAGFSIAVDASGNVYTTGYFENTVDFDPGSATANLSSEGNTDIFIQKMDASGNFLWAKSFGSWNVDGGTAITVDEWGNVYATGRFTHIVDFAPEGETVNLTSTGSSDIFVLKMDATGNFLWAKSFGGSDYDSVHSIAVDAFENVYTTGFFHGTADFDPGDGSTVLSSEGDVDIFIQKMDISGNFLWAKTMGGPDADRGWSISVDNSGNVYATGDFEGTVDFDAGEGTTNLTAVGAEDVFIQKMDASGNFLWANSFGDAADDNPAALAIDESGNIYTTGFFQGTVDFDPGSGTANLTSNGFAGFGDIFVQKMDASGNFLWVKAFGGSSFDQGQSVNIDESGNVYTTGYFEGSADFDSEDGTAEIVSEGQRDVFIQKMSQLPTGVVEIKNGIEIKAYPNPSNGLVQVSFQKALGNVEIAVTDIQGKVIYSRQFNAVSNEQININGTAGIYFLTVKTATDQGVIKIIKK
jgi:hypothetical protein